MAAVCLIATASYFGANSLQLARHRVISWSRRKCDVRAGSGGSRGGEGVGGSGSGNGGDPPRKKGGGDKGRRRFDGGFSFADGAGSGVDCAVPREQQPVNEYQLLTQGALFPWATDDIWKYVFRLASIGALSTVVVGWPVSAVSINAAQEPFKCAIGALCGGLGASTLAVVRLYLGWAYVGNRLFSATVEYEETGWYDGQIWVKPPEVLARDRLLAYYKVKPALTRLKTTLVFLAIALVTCSTLLVTLRVPERPHMTSVEMDDPGPSVVRGTYSDKSARGFEPQAFSDDADDVADELVYFRRSHGLQ
ncbi:unnamed protein product [Calypogeia fissa]